jgi:TolB-like protein
MKKKRIAIYLTVLGLLLTGLIQSPVSSAEGPKKLAIVPFAMHADRDLTFLQEGIMDMLASRLAWKGEVQVLEKGQVKKQVAQSEGPMDRAKALEIGKALQADYVIFGSLTVFGESVSLDARILDVAGAEELMTAFKQTKGMDEVIPTVDQFAKDINEKIMGRSVAPAVPVAAAAPEAPKGPGGLTAMGEDFEGKGVGHVQRFGEEIVGLDAGDVDGDGKSELVFVNKDTVFIYKWGEKAFAQFKAVKGGWSAEYVYVSVGDLDGNGRAEIYVSSLGASNVSSLVLEWDGNDFRKIAESQPWFLKVVDFPDRGTILVGQRRQLGGGFHGPVEFLKREGKGLTSTGSLPLARQGNVFNFAFADFAGGGKTSTVLIDRGEHLRLYDPAGEQVWKSEEYFGGATTYMEAGGTERVFIYMPSPIHITDVDEDGEKEVMVCKNESSTRRLLARMRLYSSGTLCFLTWNQVGGLSTKWTTAKQPGPVVGYRVFDVDNDGKQELVVASVIRGKRMFGTPRSQVVVYDLK